jgi:phospholipid:diacylglycerol acyltransferase
MCARLKKYLKHLSSLHTPFFLSTSPMSFLRRRLGGDPPSSELSRGATPEPDVLKDKRLVSEKSLQKLKSARGSKRRNLWIFGLGGIFGILVAAFFAGSNDMLDLSSLENMNMAAILEALPAGLVKDAQQLQVGSCHPSLVLV